MVPPGGVMLRLRLTVKRPVRRCSAGSGLILSACSILVARLDAAAGISLGDLRCYGAENTRSWQEHSSMRRH